MTEPRHDGNAVTAETPSKQKAENFKLTLYVDRGMVEDFDEAWARIKRGAERHISRSAAFEAAIRVALEHEEDIRRQLGQGS